MRLTCLAILFLSPKKAPAETEMEKGNIQQASDIHTYIFPHSHLSGGKKWKNSKTRARYISFIIFRVFYFLLAAAAFSALQCVSKKKKKRSTHSNNTK